MGTYTFTSIAGGYPNSGTETRATSVADQDIIPLIKAEEVTQDNISAETSFFIKEIGILVDTEARIRINDGTVIHLDPNVPYNNVMNISSLVWIDGNIAYRVTYNY